jgi:hypothetical protein
MVLNKRLLLGGFLVVAGCVSVQSAAPPVRDLQGTPKLNDWSSFRFGVNPRAFADASGHIDSATTEKIASWTKSGAAAPTGETNLWDWDVHTGSPVSSSPAVFGSSFTTASATDAFYFGTSGSSGISAGSGGSLGSGVQNYVSALGSANFFKLTDLYSTTLQPKVEWYASTGGLDGSSPVTSSDGTRIYVLDKTGKLYCFPSTVTGSTAPYAIGTTRCAGWTDFQGSAVSLSSPWLDYATDTIFFADTGGTLHKILASTGQQVWSLALGSASRSSPVVISGAIYVGDDAGALHRIIDSATLVPGSAAPSKTASYKLCGGTCAPAWGIRSGVSIDVVLNTVYVAANDTVFEFPHDTTGNTTFAPNATKLLNTGGGVILYSSTFLDYTNGFLYVGYGNKLFKVQYPFSGTTTANVYGTALAQSGADATYPRSSPLFYDAIVYIGDGAGRTEQYGCSTVGLDPSMKAQTAKYGTAVDSTPLLDFSTGNINFGYADGTTGGIVQIAQAGTWGCPTGQVSCGSAGCGGACAECCSTTDCTAAKGAGYNCNGDFTCIQNCQTPPDTACAITTATSATVTCPIAGETIVGVKFASYGTPTGTCPSSLATGACNDPNSASDVLTLCKGKSTCTVPQSTFTDYCSKGTTKSIGIIVSCSAATGTVCSTNNVTGSACSGTGACTGSCTSGFGNCNSDLATDGCESDLATDAGNCGGCNNVCSTSHVLTATCSGSTCNGTCVTGYADCNGNKLTDGCEAATSCASCCGATCTAGQACLDGVCKSTSSTTLCVDHVPNATTATLQCPSGYTIQAIPFAGYGQPTGTCPGGPFADASCDAANAVSVVKGKCLNQNSCTVDVQPSSFSNNMNCTGSIYFSATYTCSPSGVTVCP